MSKLEELIQEYCPDGVVYKKLEDCCNILDRKRRPVTKAVREAGEYPYYGANGIQDYVSEYIFDGTFVLVGEDGSVITPTGRPVVNWAEGKIWVNNHAHIVEEKEGVHLRFLYHFIQTVDITAYIHGNIPKFTGGDFRSLQVPVPPLPVQEEIVRILDSFTQLTAELQAELQARKKQYEYYRNELLNPKAGTPLVRLGDFATIIRGGNFQKKDFSSDGKYPCIHYGQMYTYFGVYTGKVLKYLDKGVFDASKKAFKNDIVMAVTSENVEDVCSCVAWLGEETIAVSGHTAIIHHNQNPKYLSYYFRTQHFFNQKTKIAHGTKVIEVTPSSLLDCLIPLPSLEEQNEIVAVLDRFDGLCNDISTGLPAEIEARRKQYEYYRDRLLTFKELS